MSEDNQERLRRALLAIDSVETRDRVRHLTHRTISKIDCPTGIEHLVNAIAAIQLSPEKWEGFLEKARLVTRGLSTGEEIGRIFYAIAEFDPEQQVPICKSAELLIPDTMSLSDRLEILRCISDLALGFEEGALFAICKSAQSLIADRISLSDRLKILRCISDLVLSFDEEALFAICAGSSALSNPLTAKDRLLILNAVSGFDPGQRAICESVKSLILDAMTAPECVQILKALGGFPLKERKAIWLRIQFFLLYTKNFLGREDLNVQEKIKILNRIITRSPENLKGVYAFLELSFPDRKNIYGLFANFITLLHARMNPEDVEPILDAIIDLPPGKREAICKMAKGLISETTPMTVVDVLLMLNTIRWLASQVNIGRNVCVNASRLISGAMTVPDRVQILNVIARLDPEQRTAICNSAKFLIPDTMTVPDRVQILNIIARLDPEQRTTICNSAKFLIPDTMSVPDRLKILGFISDLAPRFDGGNLERICQGARQLIAPAATAEDRLGRLELVSQALLEGYLRMKDVSGVCLYTANQLPPPATIGDQSQILKAVSNLFQNFEQEAILETCSLTSLIFNGTTAAERVDILKAVSNLFQNFEKEAVSKICILTSLISIGLTVAGLVEILNAVRGLDPEQREAICDRTGRLISNGMTAAQRLEILNTIRGLDPEQREAICERTERLISGRMTIAGLVEIFNAVRGLDPEQRKVICERTERLISNGMTAAERVEILNAVRDIDPEEREAICERAKRLILNGMTAAQRVEILNTVRGLDPEQREVICERTESLISIRMTAAERVEILNAVRDIDPEQRALICRSAQFLIPDTMSLPDRLEILPFITDLALGFDEEDLFAICQGAGQLSAPAATAEDRLDNLALVAQWFLQGDFKREDVVAICTGTRALSNGLAGGDRALILNAVSGLDPEQREAICSTSLLISIGMTAPERVEILNAVRGLDPEEREGLVIEEVVKLSADEIVELINNREERNAHNSLLHQERDGDGYLIIDFNQISLNPTAILRLVLMDDGSRGEEFPQIRYRNAVGDANIGVDEGGITRDFITRLISSLCHPSSPKNRTKMPMMVVDLENGYVLPKIEVGAALPEGKKRALYESQIDHYERLGVIFSLALQNHHSIRTGNQFHPSMFHILHALTDEEIDHLPEINSIEQVEQLGGYNKLLKILLKQGSSKSFCPDGTPREVFEETIDAFVDQGTIPQHMKDGYGEDVTKEDILHDDRKSREILFAILTIAKEMKENCEEEWDDIKGASGDRLRANIEGELTKELLLSALYVSPAEESQTAFVIQWINEATPAQLKNFVWATTGSSTLPTPVPEDARLLFQLVPASDRLPAFRTCISQVDLPRYANYDTFKQKLEQSIDLVVNGNAIGFE